MNAQPTPVRKTAVLGVVLTALLFLPAAVFAQTAELRGFVADSSGSALPGVTVTILNVATGVERSVVTDDQGVFRAPLLQPGSYTVVSSLMGFGTDTRKLALTVGQVADLRVSLAVGVIQESVQVVARAAVDIETTKSDLSAVVSQEQLSELPVLNRGFVGLAQLLPGGGPARTADGRFGISTAFGGTNVRSMYSMQIDGGIMDHPIYGFAIVNVSQDAVQEFRVLRNQFDAEYSRAGTAVVNVVTRSGTNDLRGQVSYRPAGTPARSACGSPWRTSTTTPITTAPAYGNSTPTVRSMPPIARRGRLGSLWAVVRRQEIIEILNGDFSPRTTSAWGMSPSIWACVTTSTATCEALV